MSTVSQAPFKYSFVTGDYPDGIHEMGAVVTLKDGTTLNPTPESYNFISANAEQVNMGQILWPLLGIIVAVIAIVILSQVLASRRGLAHVEPGTQRNYGIAGGAVCPKCGRPTPLHMMSINLLAGKYDRCENCGKWSVMRRASIADLRAAEEAEAAASKPTDLPEKSEEEKLRDMLDKSKYMD